MAHGQDEGVVAEIGLGEPGLVDGPIDEGDVELGRPPLGARGRPPQHGRTESDPRMCLTETSEHRGQIDHAQGLDGTHVQLTAEDVANPGHRVTSLVDSSQGRVRCGQKGPASLSEHDSAIVSHEE